MLKSGRFVPCILILTHRNPRLAVVSARLGPYSMLVYKLTPTANHTRSMPTLLGGITPRMSHIAS